MASHADNSLDDRFFERLAQVSTETAPGTASARLKSKTYSALMRRAVQEGPVRSLTEVKCAGHNLCVFEQAVQILPLGRRIDSLNYCRVCHARILAESIESSPIAWPYCPYVEFQKR